MADFSGNEQENLKEKETSPDQQEKFLLNTIPIIKRIAGSRLNSFYQDAVEDVTQKVVLKLWNWKNRKKDVELTEDEWKKLANTATQNEVKTFYTQNLRNETPLSGNESANDYLFRIPSEKIEGNTRHETYTILINIWRLLQTFSLRQNYAILLQNQEFIVDLISSGCCKISEIADLLKLERDTLAQIIRELPLPDEAICKIFEQTTGEKIVPKNLWEARNKAKVKLLAELKKVE